jgi:YihY family inner membrane protein
MGRLLERLDHRQQDSRWLAIPFAVIKKFSDDQGGSMAALVAYYSFLSLFPLLLVFVTVLGFVLQGNPSAQRAVEDSVLGQFPVIGDQIKGRTLEGHSFALVVGIVVSLLAGLAVTQAAQNALNRVWAVPFTQRPDFFKSRLRGLVLVLALGGMFLLASVAAGLVSGGLGGASLKVAAYAVSLAVNFGLFLASFKLLTSSELPPRWLVPGAAFAAVGWLILQFFGGFYIQHVVSRSTSTYGTFALVIGVLAWLHLGAQITMYAAEINVVLARKLYPRSLVGPPETPADRRTLRALAEAEARHEQEQIEVEFKPPPKRGDPEPPGESP